VCNSALSSIDFELKFRVTYETCTVQVPATTRGLSCSRFQIVHFDAHIRIVFILSVQMAGAVERMVQWGSGLVTQPVQVCEDLQFMEKYVRFVDLLHFWRVSFKVSEARVMSHEIS
jgi:hypothetical protein